MVTFRPLARALLVALMSLGVGIALGPSASAEHVVLEVDWGSPGSDPAAGVVVEGTASVHADVGFDSTLGTSNVKEWQVQLRDESGKGMGVLCTRSYSDLGTGVATVDFTWDSRYSPSGTVNTECEEGESANVDTTRPLANGRYFLRLRAHDQLLTTEWHHEDFAIRVNNRPSAPRDVSANFDDEEQQIRVAWTANPETDLSGYRVQQCRTESTSESCTSSDWKTVAENPSDDIDAVIGVTEVGTYRHRVVAQRPDWSQTATLDSDPASAGSPIVLEDENGDESDAPGSGDDPDSSADDPVSTLPEHVSNPDEGGSDSGAAGNERRRSLEPRLVQRDAFDDAFEDGFDEALPYGARSVDETPARVDGLLVAQEGAGIALVPIAGGLVVFVFAMQLRYLGRRASLAAAGNGAVSALDVDDGPEVRSDEPGRDDSPHDDESGDPPAFRPLLGGSSEGPGSFISNWKRWVPKG